MKAEIERTLARYEEQKELEEAQLAQAAAAAGAPTPTKGKRKQKVTAANVTTPNKGSVVHATLSWDSVSCASLSIVYRRFRATNHFSMRRWSVLVRGVCANELRSLF